MMANTCCKGCCERYAGCHAHCEKYLAWKREYDALKARIRLEKERDVYTAVAKQESLRRMARHYKDLGFRHPTNK